MTIKKYTGKTKDEAIEAAKAELGSSVVIMNIKEVRGKGLAGVFKAPSYEVTAAVEEDTAPVVTPITPKQNNLTPRFSAVADEDIKVPPMEPEAPVKPASYNQSITGSPVTKTTPIKPAFPVDEKDLKEAFEEISAVVEKGGIDQISPKASQESPIVKKTETVVKPAPMPAFKPEEKPRVKAPQRTALVGEEQKGFLKMLYNTLMDNEVEQRYVNQILADLDPTLSSDPSLDQMITNVYQKMVLMFGSPKVITLSEKRPKVVFIIGPTGVGKTTTIAKLAAKYMLEKGKKVGLLTSDTYRIAATDQLDVYARIMSTPFTIIVDNQKINDEIKKMRDMDLILVDTAGFSHKNQQQREELKMMLDTVDEAYDKEIYLVLSATTKYHDLREIVDTYRSFTDFDIIFTKLDETLAYGNILNTRLYTGAELSYVTTGQNVPDDIEIIDSQKIVKSLLGGN